MTQPARRGRMPAVADADIRRVARALLVDQGPEAVTLRAIARELGITAPALYRYYASRDALVGALRLDICADLAAELSVEVAALPEDGVVQLFALCKGFRRWALAHAREFTLVFASPAGETRSAMREFEEPFGRIFLEAAGKLLTTYDIVTPATDVIPEPLREDLVSFQTELLAVLAESGQKFPAEKLDLGVTYLMMTFWARLYGHVTLEVFGNYPMLVSDPDALFDATLADLARTIGL
ncbi:TetR/AcrR family transcriptional regulator [Nocardia terpenica]|uniref:TetR family transcriptional regulator n=1 Tax=Nocardia terpenica TaxID=455432 RepID=A0A161XHT8_9NOCA|nr:TetR/AcrR family transcriptional regulator [Nocardia terpenica]KZM73148.1 TetR family transcriptional regulator [Nocardia terpenica]MBF6064274.1 TetR/AcrR family transcriptional regulator [Nocardia terpenica]MBF6106607.1 TetR/AcrR family transcriptional regulator [Nocardia terpenica]MBF6113892.1 TetR/AcrR family transcriptional regulator [Nocardia terpenica]MBF6120484.1 TetR/AcrR family transcriptional regulator [Nocardia terpenica]